jgi:hypothetical protein
MPRMDLMRFILCSATVSLALLSITKPAQACSDLPNICQQREQQHQENVERARQEQENYYIRQRELQEQENVEGAPETSIPRVDPMQSRVNTSISILKLMTLNLREQQKLANDPRYQAYINGAWEFFQGKNGAVPGESCAALFSKKDGIVMLSGPDKQYKGALLTFFGKDIPRPNKAEKVKVTLTQPGDPPQTVQAFNYVHPGIEYGAITFAVPTIEAALATMEDVLSFDLAMKGKSVLKIEWHGGLAARDKLRQCVSAGIKN